jgi:hypothetical protein
MKRKSMRLISYEHKTRDFKLVGSSYGVITIRPVLMYYAIEIDSSLFLSGFFLFSGDLSRMSPMWIYHLYL